VRARFTQRGIDCEAIGEVQAHHQLRVVMGDQPQDEVAQGGASESAVLWDLEAEPFIAARTPAPEVPASPTMPCTTDLAPAMQEAA